MTKQMHSLKETIYYNYQSGFRTNHSTNLYLSFLADKILKAFDECLLTGMILIDLQKAFSTIHHKIPLKKLKAMGFSEDALHGFSHIFPKEYFL